MSIQPVNYELNRDNYDLTKLFETEMEAKERRANERLQFIMYNFQDKNNRYKDYSRYRTLFQYKPDPRPSF